MNAEGADGVVFTKYTTQSPLLLVRQRRFNDVCQPTTAIDLALMRLWDALIERKLIDDRNTTRVYVTPWYKRGDERRGRLDAEYINSGVAKLMGPITCGIGPVGPVAAFRVQLRSEFEREILMAMIERARVAANVLDLEGIKIAKRSRAGEQEEAMLARI